MNYPDPVFEHRIREDSARQLLRTVIPEEKGYMILTGWDNVRITGPFAKIEDMRSGRNAA